jgi:large subunit ribosomal protein L15
LPARSQKCGLSELGKVKGGTVDLGVLKEANLVPADTLHARIVLSGGVKSAFTVKGVGVTKGARAAIEAAGGTVETAA